MATVTFTKTTSSYRFAGWAAITSGIFGIMAFVFQIIAATTRNSVILSNPVYNMFRAHDVAMMLQLLLLIPVVFTMYKLSLEISPALSKPMLAAGVGALSLTVLILFFVELKILHDDYYPIPLLVFGLFLIGTCRHMSHILSQGLRWFGIVVGAGLVLVGIFPLGYAILVDPVMLYIPAVEVSTIHDTTANFILHLIFFVGLLMGVITLPFWTILIGRRLLQERP